MRVNVYAEETTDRVEVVSKTTEDGEFTGLRTITNPSKDFGDDGRKETR